MICSDSATAVENLAPDILVVDDNPDNLRLLITVLTEQNYRVRPVTQGSLAIRAAQLLLFLYLLSF